MADTTEVNNPQNSKRLDGIRGWLILPAIGLVANAFVVPYSIWNIFDFYSTSVATAENNLPVLLGVSWYEAISWVLYGMAATWLAILFFKKKQQVPRWFVIWLIVGLVSSVIDLVLETWWAQVEGFNYFDRNGLTQYLTSSAYSLARPALFTVLWAQYFSQSKRVKSTFVR